MNNKEAYQYLTNEAEKVDLKELLTYIFVNYEFGQFIGGVTHHNFEGGLLVHTAEVLKLCHSTLYTLNVKLDLKMLFAAVVYHDLGKVWDYEKTEDGNWVNSEHRYKIRHISKSVIEFGKIADKYFDKDQTDEIIHAILAHHGNVNYGSPVLPQTDLAWLLHLCDSLSARISKK